MSMPNHPNREIYDEFQRVAGSNRFIFTQAAIILGIGIILGPTGIIMYMGSWGVLLLLSLAFAPPYRILRTFWPHGNWPSQITALPVYWKVRSFASAIVLLLVLSIGMWLIYSGTLPWLSTNVGIPSDNQCMSLICILLE